MFLIGCLTSSYIALQKVTPRGGVLKINPYQGLAWPHGGHCFRPSTPENHSGWVGAGGRWGRRISHLRFLTVDSSCCTRSHESLAVVTTSAFFSQGSQVHSIPTTPKRERGLVFTHSFIFGTFLLGQLSSTRAPSGVAQGIHFTPTFPLARPRAPSQLSGGRASPFSAGSGVGGGGACRLKCPSQVEGRKEQGKQLPHSLPSRVSRSAAFSTTFKITYIDKMFVTISRIKDIRAVVL